MKNKPDYGPEIAYDYLAVNGLRGTSDGGTEFVVHDSVFGPVLVIESIHYGHRVSRTEIFTDQKSLAALAKLFLKAAEHEYTGSYVYAATVIDSGLDEKE
jgi:hypothetical protein